MVISKLKALFGAEGEGETAAVSTDSRYSALEAQIGYTFKNGELLAHAMKHK